MIASLGAPDYVISVDWASGHLRTQFNDGTVCEAKAQDDEQYAAVARELGYGDSLAGRQRMAVDNDLLHTFVCTRAGLPFCPVLWGTAHRRWWFLWQQEDNAVLAIQAMLNGRVYDELAPWRQDALNDYLRWTRPKTDISAVVYEAQEWLRQFREPAV